MLHVAIMIANNLSGGAPRRISVGSDCFTSDPTAGTHEVCVHLRPIERIESTVSWPWSVGLKAACDGGAGFKKIPRVEQP